MISKDTEKLGVLKQVQNKAQMKAKESKVEITNDIVMEAINKELKQLKESAEFMKEGTKEYTDNAYRISVISKYMPEQMSEEQIREEVKKIILELGDGASIGDLMKASMQKLKGKADNKLIRKAIGSLV